jgi:hypothetical protein
MRHESSFLGKNKLRSGSAGVIQLESKTSRKERQGRKGFFRKVNLQESRPTVPMIFYFATLAFFA